MSSAWTVLFVFEQSQSQIYYSKKSGGTMKYTIYIIYTQENWNKPLLITKITRQKA